MKRRPARTVTLRETAYCPPATEGDSRVDEERCLIRGVKILGLESKNRRRYTVEAIRNALPAYEGRAVNIDHPTRPGDQRRVTDRFGRLVNVRQNADGEAYGDLHYNPHHPAAASLIWWAKNDPASIGLSHNAVGRGQTDATGTFVVEEIVTVRSVDIVADPATTRGLYEASMNPDAMPAIDDELPAEDDTLPDEEEGGSYEDQLGELVKSIMTDAALSTADKRKKLLAALKLLDDGASSTAPSGDGKADATDADESAKTPKITDPAYRALLERIDRLEAEKAGAVRSALIERLVTEAKLPATVVTPLFRSLLESAKDEAAIKALIEDRRTLGYTGTRAPRSAGRSAPGMDAKAFAAAARK